MISQYLNGELDEPSMHELERQALDDPFLADALEGYSHTELPAGPHLSLLQKQLEERIALQQERKNVFNFTWQRISIAAAASMLFISASILFWMKGSQRNGAPIARHEKKVDISLSSIDSLIREGELDDKKEAVIRPAEVKAAEVKGKERNVQREPLIAANKKPKPITESRSELSQQIASLNASSRVAQMPEGKRKMTLMSTVVDSSKGKNVLYGKVADSNGEPLPGAMIRISGKEGSFATDKEGNFQIKDSVPRDLTIAYVGYGRKEVKAEPGKAVAIVLEEDNRALNEVVVRGYSAKSKAAEPVDGFKKYSKYIKENLKTPAIISEDVVVVLSFSVSPAGEPHDFKVIKAASEAFNNEAIRVIKEGPKWIPGIVANYTIEFKK